MDLTQAIRWAGTMNRRVDGAGSSRKTTKE